MLPNGASRHRPRGLIAVPAGAGIDPRAGARAAARPLGPPRWLPPTLALVVTLALATSAGSASGHPVSLLWTQILVHKDRIEVELVTTVEEFFYVYNLETDADGALSEADIARSMKEYESYLLEHFTIEDVDGERLEGEVTGSDVLSPEFALPMEREVTYHVVYPLEFPPVKLSLSQEFGGKDSAFPSVMTVEVEQVGYTLPQPFLLEKGAVAEIELDWLAPPLDEALEDSDSLEQKREEMLGITSFGSIYTFFYVEETEVRHEILLPLATLETWLPIEREKASVLTVAEQDAAADAIHEFFSGHAPVTVDGIAVKPRLERIDYFDLDSRDLGQVPPRKTVPVWSARVGVILEYPTKGIPDRVEMTWDLFSRDLREVRSALIAWEQSERVVLTENDPVLVWENPGRPPLPEITSIAAEAPPRPLRLPVGSVAAAALLIPALLVLLVRRAPARSIGAAAGLMVGIGALGFAGPRVEVPDPFASPPPPPPDAEAERMLASLHENIYRAFDYRAEEDVYDALARSVDGPLLADLYLGIREGLRMQEQGGAVARVETVDLESAEPLEPEGDVPDPRAFRRLVTWTVNGSVEHWGHIHSRTNRYRASFTVEPREGAWKITRMDVRSQERVSFERSIRKVL